MEPSPESPATPMGSLPRHLAQWSTTRSHPRLKVLSRVASGPPCQKQAWWSKGGYMPGFFLECQRCKVHIRASEAVAVPGLRGGRYGRAGIVVEGGREGRRRRLPGALVMTVRRRAKNDQTGAVAGSRSWWAVWAFSDESERAG
jgi:hypothetical protein